MSPGASHEYPPNDGFAEGPPEVITLPEGKRLLRYGGEGGRHVTEPGTPWDHCSLPPRNAGYGGQTPPTEYVVIQPIPETKAGTAARFYPDQPGGGKQYLLPSPIRILCKEGYLRVIPPGNPR